ncbi:MAG: GNAT family N-acetyltransferase [Acidobacteriaceae bacterium]
MPTDDPISIFAASAADHAWCAQLMASSEPWSTLQRDAAACQAALDRPCSELFLARRGDQRLGLLLLQSHGLAGAPYIAAIAVAPEARGAGVGSQMLDFAEQRYPQARYIFLCVSDFNTSAHKLYARRGYEVVGELTDHVAPGHSERIMRKKLK